MFNRSIKYILLLIVNIIVLFALFHNQSKQTNDPIDTEYVIEILQNQERLNRSIQELTEQLQSSRELVSQTQTQLENTQVTINRSEQKLLACEAEKFAQIENAR